MKKFLVTLFFISLCIPASLAGMYLEMKGYKNSSEGNMLFVRVPIGSEVDTPALIADYDDDFIGYKYDVVIHICNHNDTITTACTIKVCESHLGSYVNDTDSFLVIEEKIDNIHNKIPRLVNIRATSKGDVTSKYNTIYKAKFNGSTHTKKYRVIKNKHIESDEDL
jgi:hypothetical protein